MTVKVILSVFLACWAGRAFADPCAAIPDRGPMPAWLHKGATFKGPVPYVGDGDSLCVDVGRWPVTTQDPGRDWVEVRLADFYAPELHDAGGRQAKGVLEMIVTGHELTCRADHRSYDRIVARCTINGRSVGDLMRAAGIAQGGRGR